MISDEQGREWAAENPSKALDAALKEDCPTCDGSDSIMEFIGQDTEPTWVRCPDCVDGRRWKPGVNVTYLSDGWIEFPAEMMEDE